jgi:hypothetical protein
MPSNSLLIDPSDPNLRNAVSKLAPTPGVCIFIDVVGSTAMKQKGITHWVALIHNAFSQSTAFLNVWRPLKGIGDELMYFIEDADMKALGETPLQVYDALFQIAGSASSSIPETKVVAAHCSSVFPMTFIAGTRDYYGADVDRAARLKSVQPPLQSREVVIDDDLYAMVVANFDCAANKAQFPSVGKLTGPATLNAKGIAQPVAYFRAMA